MVSEGMAPTLNTGECAIMHHFREEPKTVARGDVVGFKWEPNRPLTIFRIVAVAGDSLRMDGGAVILNGEPLSQEFLGKEELIVPSRETLMRCEGPVKPGEICKRSRFKESLPSGRSYEIYDIANTSGDNTGEFSIPEGYVFVLGDHRDNALDSRFSRNIGGQGMVAIDEILGIFESL